MAGGEKRCDRMAAKKSGGEESDEDIERASETMNPSLCSLIALMELAVTSQMLVVKTPRRGIKVRARKHGQC
eukprot:765974-Hanusia_phi.AAC.7